MIGPLWGQNAEKEGARLVGVHVPSRRQGLCKDGQWRRLLCREQCAEKVRSVLSWGMKEGGPCGFGPSGVRDQREWGGRKVPKARRRGGRIERQEFF